MKTNKFEEILRRKLEGIQPDFQDQDWDKWQSFRQHHSPSFWQTYGHWLGYAVATLSTAVMVVLYVNQSNQNDALLKEMENLKQQVAMQPPGDSAPANDSSAFSDETTQGSKSKPDTVYIIERQTVYREVPSGRAFESGSPQLEEPRLSQNPQPATTEAETTQALPDVAAVENETRVREPNAKKAEESMLPETKTISDRQQTKTGAPVADPEKNNVESTPAASVAKKEVANNARPNARTGRSSESPNTQTSPSAQEPTQWGTSRRIELGEVAPLNTSREFANSRNYLYRRLQGRMPQKARVAPATPSIAQADRVEARSGTPAEEKSTAEKTVDRKSAESKPVQEKIASDKKTKEVTKEGSLLPKFGLNLPFRIGVGQQWTGKHKAFSLWNEVLIGSKWSLQAGVSWNTLETQKFVTEKMFKDDMREDFRKQHAKRLPPSFQIFNIITQTTLLQVPLGATYRGELGNNFTYLIGAGTSLNIRTKQMLTFDFERPTQDYGEQSTIQYLSTPAINNAQLSLGLEKRWSPIILQVGSFVETRAKTFPFLRDRTQVGLRAKLLYEFGSAKKQ